MPSNTVQYSSKQFDTDQSILIHFNTTHYSLIQLTQLELVRYI